MGFFPLGLRPLAILVFFLSWSSLGLALDPSRAITEYNCRTWTRQNGLPVNGINALAQSEDGYLYLGSAAGLVRYDGRSFDSIDLSQVRLVRSPTVKVLTATRNGGLWVGMENGSFGFWDGHEFSFRGREEYGGVTLNLRSIIEEKDGGLWIAAQREALRLKPGGEYESLIKWTQERQLNITFGFKDAQGRFWFGTAGHELFYWEAGKIIPFQRVWLKPVLCMAQDREGLIWFGMGEGLACCSADLNLRAVSPFSASVTALLFDQQGTLWLGTGSNGLAMYRNGTFSSLTKKDGLVGDHVLALLEDREGSLWIGTVTGLSQLTDIKFRTLPPAGPGVNGEFATSVCASRRGGVWVGNRLGVTYYDGNYKTYGPEAGLLPYAVKRVFEAQNGDVYMVNGLDNLAILSGEHVVAIHHAPTLIVGMAEDAQGVIASVGGQLYRASREGLTPYPFVGDKPNFEWILNLLVAKDGALVVASEAGLFRIKDGVVQNWKQSDGLVDQRVQGISEDEEGVVWASLFTGIGRLKNNQIRSINRKDGLVDDNIYAVVSDNLGSLWVDSSRGVFRVSRQMMNDFADGKISRVECVSYDSKDAVDTTDKTGTQEHVACRSLDGRIWFPGDKGVVEIDPAKVPINTQPPLVHVERALGNRKLLAPGQRVVAAGDGELEFHFNALTFIAPQKARFRYKLDGYDADWTEAANRQMAYYTNLKPGKYTFRVTATNADGVWNKTGDSREVELLPHFYQTFWFYLICGASTLTALGGFYLWRMRLTNLKQKALRDARDQLEKEVQTRTAELAAVNLSLAREVEDRKRTSLELVERTQALEKEIKERIVMQAEVERVHTALLSASRQAGMAEIATNVLHNVGNVLNSVNVSSGLALDGMRNSSVPNLERLVGLMSEHKADLGNFMLNDPRGQKILPYLAQLSNHLRKEQATTAKELQSLRQNVDHIREIVVMQQNFATASGLKEVLDLRELIEDSLKINYSALDRHGVTLERDYQPAPRIEADRHKVLQILVNLVSNAKQACNEARATDKRVKVRLVHENNRIKISITDNGVGISPENFTRIFNHGFTTRKDGHGFGLHSGAITAMEMGGSLSVESEGPGKGATFTLELPGPTPRGTSLPLGDTVPAAAAPSA